MTSFKDQQGFEHPSLRNQIDMVCDAFERDWIAGVSPTLEEYLGNVAEPERCELLRELLEVEIEYRRKGGESPKLTDYRPRFPQHVEMIGEILNSSTSSRRSKLIAPSTEYFLNADGSRQEVNSGSASSEPTPEFLGRYRIDRKLGEGAYGWVFLAYDDDLHRPVAIKVPYRARRFRPEDAEAFLAEARIVASLDHPGIVPVHDVGRTDEGLCFLVSKFIDGSDLKSRLMAAPVSVEEAVEIIASVAEALHYAHSKRLVHRDVKPANILLDKDGRAYIGDFGLAQLESDQGQKCICGTPSYMSPEQARGEYRLDGRADVWALGVILYQILTGTPPFRGNTAAQVLDDILHSEPKPPRQIDDSIAIELEEICLKALSKSVTMRFTTALDLANRLRQCAQLFLSSSKDTDHRTSYERMLLGLDQAYFDHVLGC